MRTLQLTSQIEVPQMGFGTYGIRGSETVLHALKTGYRHLDTADIYGTHSACGEAIKASGIPRGEIFITTKLWSHSVAADKVAPAVDKFLRELDTDYIDLLLIHWPSKSVPVEETLPAMEKVRQAGKIRAIGVSNFSVAQMKASLATGVVVCNNQIEYNIEERPDDIVEYCQANQVTVTAYSPVKAQGQGLIKKAVAELAKAHNCTGEEVILAWLLAKNLIVIPRSSNPKHIDSNYHSLELNLSADEIAALNG
jgi:diketogulonate reductase-like aldo/keto reductase